MPIIIIIIILIIIVSSFTSDHSHIKNKPLIKKYQVNNLVAA